MSELARLNLAERGILLTADQMFNPNKVSLVDGICRVNGCTGSFVSQDGLIITNHHCAFGAIQQASTARNDLLTNGFNAQTRDKEISAPDYQIRITESFEDISAEVLAAVKDGMSYGERTRAIEKRRKELEQQAEAKNSGLRAEVAEMFEGKTYLLFLYTYIKDVRLVFAPPASVGNFGGDTDNWEWPRHTGDFSFMRAYVAPDGSSATYSPENVPYQPKRFIQVQPNGVDENDAVFLLGYPGRTARHKTASFLQYERDVRLPMTVDLYNWQIGEMEKAGMKNREVTIKHANRSKSLANVEKRSRGQLQGIRRALIVETRQQQEAQLQAFIDSDPQRKAVYGNVLRDIAVVYSEMSQAGPLDVNLAQLRSACRAIDFGFFAYDSAVERQKDDLDRESDYMTRNFPQTTQRYQVAIGDWHQETDQIMLAGMLDRLSQVEEGKQNEALNPFLQSPETNLSFAQEMMSETQMGRGEFVMSCLDKTPEDLATMDDPVMKMVIRLYPTWIAMREKDKEREGRLNQLYGSLIEVKQEFLATNFVPDANATLRFTCGHVRAYSPVDAIIKTPISTLKGVIDKTTGQDPFITPDAVMEKYQAGEFGRFVNPKLGQVPVAILYDTDTTGGNSGSPVLNGKGELVGVNFDRCFEATINDFAWDQSYSRSIGVDIRYVLWITGIVYGGDHLLKEMGVSGSN